MRLLVVEDEPDLLSGLVRALRKQGYAVDTAEDGELGLYKARNTDYDAVVLDVMMPKLDGWDVLERLRADKSTPVLMLTARDTTRDRVRGLDGGADDYLVKPFDIDELLARIRVLVRRKVGRQASVTLDLGEVTINTVSRVVMRGGCLVPLTAREYGVLHYLAINRGEVVSRTTLYEHLFDEEDETLSNLIDVHVSNLRKKLGAELIQTRRGHGYVIE
ncbi:MAG: response regulator transcription factor [Verrucomicrobiota bacterium]